MRLSADIKWTDYTSRIGMRNYLYDFVCSKKSNQKGISIESTLPPYDKIEIIVKCGKIAERSCFVFLRCSRNKSRIVGTCSTNRLFDLVDDFDFLTDQMKRSNLSFDLSDPRVTLDSKKFIEEGAGGFLQMDTFLADFFAIVGFILGAVSYLFFGEFNQITVLMFVLGFSFWIGSVVTGKWNRPKYVLIESE